MIDLRECSTSFKQSVQRRVEWGGILMHNGYASAKNISSEKFIISVSKSIFSYTFCAKDMILVSEEDENVVIQRYPGVFKFQNEMSCL